MRASWMIVAAVLLLATTATSQAKENDSDTCFSTNSDAWKDPEFFPKAMAACNRLIKSRTGTAQAAAYRARGYWKHRKQEYKEAIEDYNRAIKMEPSNIEGYNYRADSYRDSGQLDLAIADYDLATAIDPAFAAAYYNRGYVYELKGDRESARKQYEQALACPAPDRLAQWAHEQARARLDRLSQ